MTGSTKAAKIRRFLLREGWLAPINTVSFLAAGEYNENYLVRSNTDSYVFRINHGSQLGLDNQIEYEFMVLKAVEPSLVTPKAHHFRAAPNTLNAGVLLMDYMAGRKFEYQIDWQKAAIVFANIHLLQANADLIVQANPVQDIAQESFRLINAFDNHPLKHQKRILLEYFAKITAMAPKAQALFSNECMCVVNTEVNSGNFIVERDRAFLVDWEKAVISNRYQDLGHFLVSTTTLWKSDYRFSEVEKRQFLSMYRDAAHIDIGLDELYEKTRLLEKTILLRAMSWCYMAYYEYTNTQRQLSNVDTFSKIKKYMDEIDSFLDISLN